MLGRSTIQQLERSSHRSTRHPLTRSRAQACTRVLNILVRKIRRAWRWKVALLISKAAPPALPFPPAWLPQLPSSIAWKRALMSWSVMTFTAARDGFSIVYEGNRPALRQPTLIFLTPRHFRQRFVLVHDWFGSRRLPIQCSK